MGHTYGHHAYGLNTEPMPYFIMYWKTASLGAVQTDGLLDPDGISLFWMCSPIKPYAKIMKVQLSGGHSR